MFTWLADKSITAFENHYGYDATYMHNLLETAPGAYRRFSKVIPMATHQNKIPADAFYIAKIAAMLSEDCGSCLQLAVKMALEARIARVVIQAALDGGGELPPHLYDVYNFAMAVAQNKPLDDALAARVKHRYGPEGVAELALGIAGARIFPTIKRALGYNKSCSMVRIEL